MTYSPERTTKIFLDSGSAEDTRQAKERIGFLDGQTTNPTYFVKKNPEVQKAIEAGKRFTSEELIAAYKKLIQEVSPQIPAEGSVSIEVYADKDTSADTMITQGKEFSTWVPNAHIKLPIITAGLEAARALVDVGIRVNMTLCFSQDQAAAVHAATRGASPGQVFVSPFVSRLDKIGKNGFDILVNIQRMYRAAHSHVSILAASVHSVYDIAHILEQQIDIITVPFDDIPAWVSAGMPDSTTHLPPKDTSKLSPIAYQNFDLKADWHSFDISHQLTDKGLAAFAADWNSVLS
jgi:transaldolase